MAGLPVAMKCAYSGMETALVEEDLLGGTCLNRGCIPTKAMIRSVEVANLVHRTDEVGIENPGATETDMEAVVERQQSVVESIRTGAYDNVENTENLELIEAHGRFESPTEIAVGDRVLMDREFDSQHVLEAIADRGLTYVAPKRMQTSEKAQATRLLQRDEDRYVTERKLHLGNNEWHETTLQYRRKKNSNRTDYGQYAVFMTNASPGAIAEYGKRWDIERGYKSIKRFMAATTSKKKLRPAVLLFRVRVSPVLGLAGSGSISTGRIDG